MKPQNDGLKKTYSNEQLKKQIIKFSKKLNSTNLSALRSGNISARAREKGVDGFYITPSGMRYDDLKPKIIKSDINICFSGFILLHLIR